MAYLFKIEEKIVFPNEETLLISPFREIWKRDKTKDKRVALEEFTYIEFMSSVKKSNPYKGYSEEIRPKVLLEQVITTEGWKPDKLVEEGIEKIREFQEEASPIYAFYKDTKGAAERLRRFFREVDPNERNPKTGQYVHKPKDIIGAIADTEKLLSTMKKLKDKVEEELFEEVKNRSNKVISVFADPE